MSPQPLVVQSIHPLRSEMYSYPAHSIHRKAHDFCSLVSVMPRDPLYQIAPRAIVVGSFALTPSVARDLDCEVFGVSWEHLQGFFSRPFVQARYADVVLTRGGANGIIDPLNPTHAGNAFVAVWLTHHDGTKLNVSIPLLVSSDTQRYDLNSVVRVPLASFREASLRRDFVHKSAGYDPLSGARGEILDPHGALLCLSAKQLRLLCPSALVNDPITFYRSVRTICHDGFAPDADTFELLCKAAQSRLSIGVAVAQRDRLAYERSLGLMNARPSLFLNELRRLGGLERECPGLGALAANAIVWERLMMGIDKAWASAQQQHSWSADDKLALVLARFLFEVEQEGADMHRADLEDIFISSEQRRHGVEEAISASIEALLRRGRESTGDLFRG